MASSLFPSNNNNNLLAAVQSFKGMAGGNPQAAFEYMYRTNPSFRSFADSMKSKDPHQAFSENGLDYTQVQQLLR